MASRPIKWRQCVDNQRPPLGEYDVISRLRHSFPDPDMWIGFAMSNEKFRDFFVIMLGEQLYSVWLVQEFFTSIR